MNGRRVACPAALAVPFGGAALFGMKAGMPPLPPSRVLGEGGWREANANRSAAGSEYKPGQNRDME